MGQKVNPINFRLQVNKNWSSRWFTANKKEFAEAIRQDHEIRELIEKKFASRPTINRIEIERSANLITVTIHTAKAGVVIGRGGAGVSRGVWHVHRARLHGHAGRSGVVVLLTPAIF